MAKSPVPNLRAHGVTTEREAERILEDHGFTLGTIIDTDDNDRDAGVSGQNPPGGSLAEPLTVVTFRLNTPTITVDDGMVSMPNLMGLYPDEAESRLRSLGIIFDLNRTFREVPSGLDDETVVGQSPAPHMQVKASRPEGLEVQIARNDLQQKRIKRVHRTLPEPPKPGRWNRFVNYRPNN